MRQFVVESDKLESAAFLRGVLHVLLDVTKLCLGLAEDSLTVAFCLQLLIAHELAGEFLDLAFRFFDSA